MRSSSGTALCRSTRIEALQAAKPAIQALYQALTPEQRAIFDTFRRWCPGTNVRLNVLAGLDDPWVDARHKAAPVRFENPVARLGVTAPGFTDQVRP